MNIKGFTLVELMVTVIIIGIVAAIAVPHYLNTQEKGFGAQAIETLNIIHSAEGVWAIENSSYTNSIANLQSCATFVANDGEWTYSIVSATTDTFTATATRNNGRFVNYYITLNQTATLTYFDDASNDIGRYPD
ncbi:MAG: prepilin-type N-terminal cleavage/methylation domain-containing protein [Candidatus Omnitrophota bacterium]